jgi:dTDP-4-amino-4,6-dideoxygalactose transaminase
MIAQTDPRAGYLRHKDEIDRAIGRALAGGQYILGPDVKAFEEEFAAFARAKHAVGVANGTDALALALLALDVRPGDAVITVSHTAVATVAAVEMIGAVPVLVDTDACFCISPESAGAAIEDCRRTGRRIGAIIPVHLFGQPSDMIGVSKLAAENDVPLLEDCSQAHGAKLGGAVVGSFGAIAAYSCYPTKNLGAIGDAGIVTTNDARLKGDLQANRQYGWRERFISSTAGRNSRLDEIQAAILRVKLRTLPADNERRRTIAAAYDEALANLPLGLPVRRAGAEHVFHQYVIRVEDRDGLRERLAQDGIATGLHYPVPVHLQSAYLGRVPLAPGGLGHTETSAKEILSLPMYPELSDDDVGRVVEGIRRAIG